MRTLRNLVAVTTAALAMSAGGLAAPATAASDTSTAETALAGECCRYSVGSGGAPMWEIAGSPLKAYRRGTLYGEFTNCGSGYYIGSTLYRRIVSSGPERYIRASDSRLIG